VTADESKAEGAKKVLFCVCPLLPKKGFDMIKVTDLVNY
jgi:hypothetical protein